MSVLKPSRLALTVAGALAFGALAACQTPSAASVAIRRPSVPSRRRRRQTRRGSVRWKVKSSRMLPDPRRLRRVR